jgi:hypothetical protein
VIGLRDLLRRRRVLRWTIVTSAPKGEAKEQWGDTWFARDLADALTRQGQVVKVVSRAGASVDKRADDDVVLVLRGLREVQPPSQRSNTWMMWVISHPELVTAREMDAYDAVFAASSHWQAPEDRPWTPLLQATNPRRFHPAAATSDSGPQLLFVGSTRGEFRPVVRAVMASSRAQDLTVYGVGWQEFLPAGCIAGEFLPNEQLPAAYAAAGIVLNDHHTDMAQQGFLSNRLFDAVACGARVVSDQAAGLKEVFGPSVVVFDSDGQLEQVLQQEPESIFPSAAERRERAEELAQSHSFDARAAVLIERARDLRGER